MHLALRSDPVHPKVYTGLVRWLTRLITPRQSGRCVRNTLTQHMPPLRHGREENPGLSTNAPGGDAAMSDSSLSAQGVDESAYDIKCGEDKTSPAYREIQHGPAKTIVGIVDDDGACASHDYVTSLSAADQAQFKARFERYTQVGFLRSPKEMRIIEETNKVIRVHEIKTRNGHRLFGVVEATRFVASHGAPKPKNKDVKKHAAQARTAYEEALAREEAEKEQ